MNKCDKFQIQLTQRSTVNMNNSDAMNALESAIRKGAIKTCEITPRQEERSSLSRIWLCRES
jgi:hypothetical protein